MQAWPLRVKVCRVDSWAPPLWLAEGWRQHSISEAYQILELTATRLTESNFPSVSLGKQQVTFWLPEGVTSQGGETQKDEPLS